MHIINVVKTAINEEVKPDLLQEFYDYVSDWDTEIQFGARTVVQEDGISVYIFPKGPNKKIFIYVSKGTKRHVIKAVRAPGSSSSGAVLVLTNRKQHHSNLHYASGQVV